MRRLELTIMFLAAGLFNSASAQYHSNYRTVIKAADNMRYSGRLISINDCLLVMIGPERVDPSKKIVIYKNTHIALKPDAVRSIRISRNGEIAIGLVTGCVSGFYIGLKSGSNKAVNTGSLGGDIGAKAGYTIIGMVLGSILGSATGALAGHSLSTRLVLKKLDLKDFSSIKHQIEPFQAKLIK